MIGNKVRLHEDQRLYAKAVNQKVQGKWTQWKSLIQRDMSWSALLRSSTQILSFSLGVTYDTLGTPVNLKRWNLVDSDTCDLCESRCSVQHILSGCKVALAAGRYRYRHDSVLKSICHVLTLQLKKANESGVIQRIKGYLSGRVLSWPLIGKEN